MAHLESVQNESLKEQLGVNFFWNVSSSVGYGCPNKQGDVLLIQFFLNGVFRNWNSLGWTNVKLLVPDGAFGGKTWSRIREFQSELKSYSVVDGMISHANGTDLFTPKQHQYYSIYTLNIEYSAAYPTYFRDIRRDPKVPAVLSSILSGPMPDL